jgi:hypothetical protein
VIEDGNVTIFVRTADLRDRQTLVILAHTCAVIVWEADYIEESTYLVVASLILGRDFIKNGVNLLVADARRIGTRPLRTSRRLSRHTKSSDPLKGQLGFDATRHQCSWRSVWCSLLKAAGLEGLRFHDLRHTLITLMAERGVPLPVVQSMVGHMSARMTRSSTHISSNAARQAVELLDQPQLVGKFVGETESTEEPGAKLFERPDT